MEINVEALIDLLDFKLVFSTNEGQFEGVLKLIMVKKQRVTFEHTYQLSPRKFVGTTQIQFCDLQSYKLKEDSNTIPDESKFDSVEHLAKAIAEKKSVLNESEIIDQDSDFHKLLPEHLQNFCPNDYCFIESDCPVFVRAINHILESSIVGVSFHGPELSRHGTLSWICVSTSLCVFVFDINSMGITAFDGGLRKILESETILKVIHDCREPADCLKHLFQTSLQNVFDVQVADYLITMQDYTGEVIFKDVSCLSSCLSKYLKLPHNFLHSVNKCESREATIEFYKERTVRDELKKYLIISVLYLLALHEEQEKLLLYPFHQAVNIYLNVLRDASEAEIFKVPNEFSQTAPYYLSESINIVRFYDMPVSDNEFKQVKKRDVAGTPSRVLTELQ